MTEGYQLYHLDQAYHKQKKKRKKAWMLLPNNIVSLQINLIIFVVLLRVIFTKISVKYHSNHVQKAK